MVVGTVVNFQSRNGFGFIQPEGTTAKKDQVFVHWKQINSTSKWPKLDKDQVVSFTIGEIKGKSQAIKVSNKNGKALKMYNLKKTYDEDNSYTGKVKFFDSKKAYGFITPEDDDIEFNDQSLGDDDEKKGLYFTREDILIDEDMNTNNIKNNTEVTFCVYTEEGKDGLCAGRIQLPLKQYEEGTTYTGKVKFFDRRKGFGFITPDNSDIELNGEVLQDNDCYFKREDIKRAEDGSRFCKNGAAVKFEIYTQTGQTGVCAGRIVGEDGEPMERTEEEKEKAMKRKANWEAKNSGKKKKISAKKAKK